MWQNIQVIQYNTMQHNATQSNATQNNTIQYNWFVFCKRPKYVDYCDLIRSR